MAEAVQKQFPQSIKTARLSFSCAYMPLCAHGPEMRKRDLAFVFFVHDVVPARPAKVLVVYEALLKRKGAAVNRAAAQHTILF
jgi:hypothetical protein